MQSTISQIHHGIRINQSRISDFRKETEEGEKGNRGEEGSRGERT